MPTKRRDDVVGGDLTFNPSIRSEVLVALVEEWLQGDDGNQFLTLFVRPASKDQRKRIVFLYEFEPGPKGYSDQYHRITDQLKRRFGNDFIGWNIASPVWIVR